MGFDRTVTLLPGNKLKDVSRRDIVMALIQVFSPRKAVSVQFGYDCIRVVFEMLRAELMLSNICLSTFVENILRLMMWPTHSLGCSF